MDMEKESHFRNAYYLPAIGARVEHAVALVEQAEGAVGVGRVVIAVVALAHGVTGLELCNNIIADQLTSN